METTPNKTTKILQPASISLSTASGKVKKYFFGATCVLQFIKYVFERYENSEKNEKFFYFSHNFSSFDGFFLLKELFALQIIPKLNWRESRLLEASLLKGGIIVFRDSVRNFVL